LPDADGNPAAGIPKWGVGGYYFKNRGKLRFFRPRQKLNFLKVDFLAINMLIHWVCGTFLAFFHASADSLDGGRAPPYYPALSGVGGRGST
jgi:hypothetical protein